MSKVFGLLSERNSSLRSRHRQLNICIINAESLSLLHQNLSNITNVSCRFNLAHNPEQQKNKIIKNDHSDTRARHYNVIKITELLSL